MSVVAVRWLNDFSVNYASYFSSRDRSPLTLISIRVIQILLSTIRLMVARYLSKLARIRLPLVGGQQLNSQFLTLERKPLQEVQRLAH